MQNVRCNQVLAGQIPEGSKVELRGWVRTRRDSKAGISFVLLTDGSCQDPVQVVAPSALPNYQQDVLRLSAGCSLLARGTIVKSQGKGQAYEMQADGYLFRSDYHSRPRKDGSDVDVCFRGGIAVTEIHPANVARPTRHG